ncbi:MAG: hypothetical protein AAGA75_16250 [Cyanobacteria bacterium P01_E01_bin.6]
MQYFSETDTLAIKLTDHSVTSTEAITDDDGGIENISFDSIHNDLS